MSDKPRRLTRWIEAASTRVMGPLPKREPNPIEVDRGRGLFSKRKKDLDEGVRPISNMTTTNGVTVTKPGALNNYYTWYETDGVVRSAVDSLAESAVGQGYYTRIDEEEPEESKELVDELGKELKLDAMNKNVCINMLIAGFCPVETHIAKFPVKCSRKIIHPMSVYDFAQDKDNNILWLRQKDPYGQPGVKIDGKNLTWFTNNQIGNDLTGTSIIQAVESLLATKQTAIDNMDGIIDRKLYPIAVWKSRRDIGTLKNNVQQTEAGQDLYFGNLSDEEMKPGALFEIVEVQGDSKFWEYISYIDVLIYRGLYAPDLYYWKDATLASSQELTDMTDRRVQAIQRDVKRPIEAGFFDRLMLANGLIAEPRLVWGIERTGVEDLQLENIIAEAIRSGMLTEENLSLLLKLMGLDLGKLGYTKTGLEPEEPEPDEDETGEDEIPDEDENEEEESLKKVRLQVYKKLLEDAKNGK